MEVIAGKPDDYEDHPSEAVLIVEVTDTSQHHDRKRKAKQYARAGIADYRIMNLRLDAVEVLRVPQGGLYRTRLVFHRGETLSPLARPEISIAVDDLLPRKGRRLSDDTAEYERLLETVHLLRSPRNAERLLLALDQARRGEGIEMSVEELRREVLGGEGTR